ncbi:MAG: Ig-like domain-containing protein [Planctomycetaceae bacterium]
MKCVSTILAAITIIVSAGCGEAEDDEGAVRNPRAAANSAGVKVNDPAELTVSPVASRDTNLIERIEIYGLPAEWLDDREGMTDPDEWVDEASLRVRSEDVEDPPAILGEWRIELEEEALIFFPRYALAPGLTYELTLSDASGREEPLRHVFSTPPRAAVPAANVAAIHPSRGVLPENQLKFYLVFSAPMSRGQAYDHIRLYRVGRIADPSDREPGPVGRLADPSKAEAESAGRIGNPSHDDEGAAREQVEDPFLQLGEELWDPSGTRFTLLIDPGRIKRGLKPREEIGPVLEEGGRYALVIEPGWEDANGNPVAERFEKAFRVGPPDETQPSIDRWTLDVPAAGARHALAIAFDEPLDRAMLERVLVVKGPDGTPLPGEIAVDQEETRWRFTPEAAWVAGAHTLAVDAALEDLAGNSLDRPFEVDVFEKVDRSLTQRTVERKFVVKEPMNLPLRAGPMDRKRPG